MTWGTTLALAHSGAVRCSTILQRPPPTVLAPGPPQRSEAEPDFSWRWALPVPAPRPAPKPGTCQEGPAREGGQGVGSPGLCSGRGEQRCARGNWSNHHSVIHLIFF